MIKIVKGDLIKMALDGKFDVIIHGCNCMCVMGAGLAKKLKTVFPEVYKADLKTLKGDYTKLGGFSVADVSVKYKKFQIVNAYIQYEYGHGKDFVDYDAMERCFRSIIKLYSNRKFGIPKIGSGLAGGNWDKIFGIIHNIFKLENVIIVEYDR